MSENPVEVLRRIWTPEREVEEISADMQPQTALDSMVRDLLCRVIMQRGPVTLDMDAENRGRLRWEIVAHETSGRRQVSIWIE